MLFKFYRLLIISLLFLLLSNCGSSPTKPEVASKQENRISLEDIPELLEKAKTLEAPERTSTQLNLASLLIEYGEVDWSRSLVSEIDTQALTPNTSIDYAIVTAKHAELEGEHFVAKRLLFEPLVEDNLPLVSAEKQVTLYDKRATLLFNIAEYRNALDDRLKIENIVADRNQRELNQDLIWQTLMALPLEDLRMESQMQSNPVLQGWYTLAAISKDNQTNLHRQLQQVDLWAMNWPEHPASLRLPADLQLLRQLVEEQPQQIALLLPLEGRVAKAAAAIRDGFMAAYYASSGHATRPDIRVYDTSTADINEVYQEAIADGAQLTVGPLNKENIQTLALQTELPVPTLALNYIDTSLTTNNLFQFGLAVEDESKQVAKRAWQDGSRRAMILAPKGNWGDRSVITFADTWKELGGEIVGEYRFQGTKDYSKLIKEAMHIAESEQRKSNLQRRIGKRVEFEPRRRRDLDAIFLVAYPAQARQIKPTLAFHYAGSIPVYSTSHIYNGQSDSSADRDMNAIRFTTLPWFFNDDLPEKRAIEKYAKPHPTYQRLYALGVDAYHLFPRLRQLEQVKQAHFYGTTGALSLNQERKIVREQTWAQFIRGQAYYTPSTTYSNTEDNDALQ